MILSIITINKNNKTGLQKTMDSVFMQDFNDFEFIEAKEEKVVLAEGEFHQGEASVIRIFAVKKQVSDLIPSQKHLTTI